jgi:colanic acid/amylovoran biosynthesis glycosyltransferase
MNGTPSHRRSILYVVSRFPRLSETFVVREWWQLTKYFDLGLAALLPGDPGVTHPDALALGPHVQFIPALAPSTISANLGQLARRPPLYLKTLLEVISGSYKRPAGGALKGCAIFWKSVRLARDAKRQGVTQVHAHFVHHPATAALVVHRLTGLPFSVTVHADDLFIGPALLQEKVSEAMLVVAISEFNKRMLLELVPDCGRIEVVHCGVDVSEFSFRERTQIRNLICVARLTQKKGQDDLLRALAGALRTVPDLTLTLIGSGPDEAALVDLSTELKIQDRVQFSGGLSSPDVKDALSRADLFVLPARERPDGTFADSRMDGIPVALMEAMASGLPVISTTISGIPELVVNEATGLLVSPDSPAEVTAAILRLVSDPEYARQLARRARQHVAEQFNVESEGSRLAELFEEAYAHNHPAAAFGGS